MAPPTLHLVSHTHWDREWYLTYQQFRMRLVEVVDNVLHTLETSPSFHYFHLDGQTIVLEDYLQIRPQNEERVRNLIREGRLIVGPWYQLMDEFLVSGESIIRSLLIGQRIAREFGASMPVGYLADQFGNISQIPQILRGFGIDNCLFGRGIQLEGDRTVEFIWKGPDGSTVTCALMAWWYNNAQRVPANPDEATAFFRRLNEAMAPKCATGQLLLMNGVDHLDVQENIGEILDGAQEAVPGARLVHSTMEAYMQAVQERLNNPWVHEGEMREDRHGEVLPGVLSARLYLKQANSRCETLLEKVSEPAALIAWTLGFFYDRDLFRYAWKRLMWNHPHDSICGCSIDQVHREMMPRFDEVQQIGEELASRAFHGLASRIAFTDRPESPRLVVFNTLGFERTGLVEATVDFPLGPATREGRRPEGASDNAGPGTFTLRSDAGDEVYYQVVDAAVVPVDVLSPVELPFVQWMKRFRIKFVADDVPAMGYRSFVVEPGKYPPKAHDSLTPYSGALENECLLVEIMEDGSLHVLEKATERDYEGCNAFEDSGDAGDEYYYRAPIRDEVITTLRSGTARVALVESGPAVATYRIEHDILLPVSLTSDRRSRSEERAVTRVVSLVSLAAGSSRIEISTTIDNQSRDHRIRALFPTNFGATKAFAEGQFDVLMRPSRPPADWRGASPTHPQQSWVDVSDAADGLSILNRGLTEYELLDDQDSTIALTLLRCVGLLSATGAGPAIHTPDAQCPGKQTAEYAIYPHAGAWDDARTWREAHSFRTPLRCVQVGRDTGGETEILRRQQWRRGRQGFVAASLPAAHSYLSLAPDEVVVSAFKLAEDRDAVVLRLFNISQDVREALVSPGFPCVQAWRLDLSEARAEALSRAESGWSIPLGPKEIATIEFELGPQASAAGEGSGGTAAKGSDGGKGAGTWFRAPANP